MCSALLCYLSLVLVVVVAGVSGTVVEPDKYWCNRGHCKREAYCVLSVGGEKIAAAGGDSPLPAS